MGGVSETVGYFVLFEKPFVNMRNESLVYFHWIAAPGHEGRERSTTVMMLSAGRLSG